MTWTPWVILSGLVLEIVSAWIERHAVHPEPYAVMHAFRFCIWGTIPEWDKTRAWFFALKLPSYQWMRHDYDRRIGWHQLQLVWVQGAGWSRSGYFRV